MIDAPDRVGFVPVSFRRLAGAGVAAAALAAVIVLASSRGDVDRMAYGDGLIYRYVAAHFAQPLDEIDPVLSDRGVSLRYGRIGLPATIWVAAAGYPPAMPYAQPIVIVIAAGFAGAAAAALLPGAGPLGAFIPFVAPGFSLAVAGAYAEPLAVAFGLWAVYHAVRGRWWLTALLLGAALLTRENAGAVLVGLVLWCALGRRPRPIAILATSVVPVLVWYAFVASRYGHIPILDPYLRVTTDTVGAPVVSVWRSLTGTAARSAITAALHLALAAVGFSFWRRSVLGAIAAASGLQVLSAGRFSWRFVGDAFRVFTFLQLFVVLAVLANRWRAGGDEQGDPTVA